MLKISVLILALGLLALSTFTLFKVPTLLGWKATLLVGEYGQFLAIGSLLCLLFALAMEGLRGPLGVILALSQIIAVVLYLRPAFEASRQAVALGESEGDSPAYGKASVKSAFAWDRLWKLGYPRPEVATYVYSSELEELRLDFYSPSAQLGRSPVPCIVAIHGGGWNGGERTELPQFLGFLADRGYAVASIDYRLAPKYTWPAPQEDVSKALQCLADNAARLGIDPSRFALFGRSAGGQIASASALNLQDSRIRAVIAFYSPFDMRFAWNYGEPDDVLNSLSLLRGYLGGTPEEQPQGYESASAYLQFDGSPSIPFLMVHGKMDTLVWVRQSQRFAAKLAELGHPHSYLELGWGTHAFDHNLHGPSGQISSFAVMRFLRDTFKETSTEDARPETSSGPNALRR